MQGLNQPPPTAHESPWRFTKILGIGAAVFFFLANYRSTLVWLVERASGADSYYSHAFLIPFISAYIIWRRRRAFFLPFEPTRWGLLLVFAALLVHLTGMLLDVYFISGFSIVLFLFGLFLYLFGRDVTRQFLFPLAFLLFMVPLPGAALEAVAVPMKIFATASGATTLEFFGVPVVREGFQLYFPSSMLVVGNPCSGLRSLLALLALGSLYAFFYEELLWKRVFIFLAAVPLAVACNIARVILLSVIAYKFGSKAATGILHDVSGMLVFAAALVCLIGMGRVMRWRP